jgi:hypothetical protein
MKKVKILTIFFTLVLIGCHSSVRSSKPRIEPDGFRDIKWGTELSALGGMEKVEQDKSSDRGLVWYRREGDALAIGKGKLENIFYSFWMGNFESVWIDIQGKENFEGVKEELFKQFGDAPEFNKSMRNEDKMEGREQSATHRAGELYAWWGKDADMLLIYSKERDKGTLTINSRKISEERSVYEKQREKDERLK